MDKITLSAQKRTVVGRKIKKLRKEGILPANIYGKKVSSVSISLSQSDFDKVYKKAGETGLIELTLEGKVRPVLIHNIQYDPVSGKHLHADFYQVDLKEKVTARVPVVLIGVAPAVSLRVGVLLTQIDELEVEALPSDLPDKVEVNVDGLSSVDQTIKVADIKLSDKVKILTSLDREIVKVAPLVSKEAEKQAAEEEAAKAAAAAEASATSTEGLGAPSTPATTSDVAEKKPAVPAGKEESPKPPPSK